MIFSMARRIAGASILGMNRRNLELVLPRNQRRHYPLADDKLLTKVTLKRAGVPVAPTLATFNSFREVSHIDEKLDGLEDFVIKPARGSGGRGILVIRGRSENLFVTSGGRVLNQDGLIRHIGDIVFGVYALDKPDIAIVEPRLKPAPFFASLYPDGLSDVRVILADEKPALSMIRVPTRASDGRANLHQGALGIGVDIATGMTCRALQHRRRIDRHPDNDTSLVGHVVPGWRDIVAVATAAARALPLKFLGVDMVVDEHLGPLVLEVNVRPGIEIQNVNGVSLLDRLRDQGVLE